MNLKKGELIELDEDNNEYVVVETITDNNENYVVLSTTEEPIELKVCKEEFEGTDVFLTEVEKQKEIDNIIGKLNKESN